VSRSSLRVRPVRETLELARRVAPSVGITRVTDTTSLDRLGVPVFASVRPTATRGSLCVSAGKGLTADDAEVGAIMEAIELAYAEPQRARPARREVPAGELLQGGDAFRGLAPHPALTPSMLVSAIEAIDIRTHRTVLVPTERVLFPLLPGEGGGPFGSNSNGVASGNTVEEATLHALAEVIERDVTSFVFSVRDDSRRIANATLPPHLAEIARRLDRLGFELCVRWAPNPFGLAYFLAGIADRDDPDRAHRGDGLHPDATIAATRAICEAAQSRLTDIHGGRDDLAFHRARDNPADDTPASFRRFVVALGSGDAFDFAEVPSVAVDDLATAMALLAARLDAQGISQILRVELGPPDLGLHVVRVIVPQLECKTGVLTHSGPRLRAAYAKRAPRA